MMQSVYCIVFAAAYVYTVGDIGEHRVVSTKLPQIGRDMSAQISSGGNVTRLLGTYNLQKLFTHVQITLHYITLHYITLQ